MTRGSTICLSHDNFEKPYYNRENGGKRPGDADQPDGQVSQNLDTKVSDAINLATDRQRWEQPCNLPLREREHDDT
ncbi:unnamed protein product [Pieris macdunnoughi]|uniref:Uncharacterized protein n=1 Tax=Pieris macdunnoughi TaxID=345717 RepID=A0A821NML1_9NEOP|nr:unnamed protein product [Pieris macdunnoughi]